MFASRLLQAERRGLVLQFAPAPRGVGLFLRVHALPLPAAREPFLRRQLRTRSHGLPELRHAARVLLAGLRLAFPVGEARANGRALQLRVAFALVLPATLGLLLVGELRAFPGIPVGRPERPGYRACLEKEPAPLLLACSRAFAPALEALFGWLYLQGRRERVNELFSRMMEEE